MVTGNLKGDRFLVYDFQTGEIIALVSKAETLKVEGVNGHQSKLLKIVPWDGKTPMFLGTDLNFSCGGLEIADITYYYNRIVGLLETDWVVPVKLTFVIPGLNGYETVKVETVSGQKRFFVSF